MANRTTVRATKAVRAVAREPDARYLQPSRLDDLLEVTVDVREAGRGRTGRGVFRHAEIGSEHAGMERRLHAHGLARIEKDTMHVAG